MDVEIHRPPFGVDSELGRGLILGDCIRTIVAPLLDYMVHEEQIHLLGASSPFVSTVIFAPILRTVVKFEAIPIIIIKVNCDKLTGNEETTNYQRFIACVAQGITATMTQDTTIKSATYSFLSLLKIALTP
ncbi:hypothetical protein Tco_0529421 [Tanacetum coccineum]